MKITALIICIAAFCIINYYMFSSIDDYFKKILVELSDCNSKLDHIDDDLHYKDDTLDLIRSNVKVIGHDLIKDNIKLIKDKAELEYKIKDFEKDNDTNGFIRYMGETYRIISWSIDEDFESVKSITIDAVLCKENQE